jgi:hypothetical protein
MKLTEGLVLAKPLHCFLCVSSAIPIGKKVSSPGYNKGSGQDNSNVGIPLDVVYGRINANFHRLQVTANTC